MGGGRAATGRGIAGRLLRACAAAGLLACASPAGDDSDGLASGRSGAALYLQYCASCHGVSGEGDGPVAAEMKSTPADLTRLGQRYGSPLPKLKLVKVIDGREVVRAHGTPEMPVWGQRFFADVPGQTRREWALARRLAAIVEYVESLQRSD